MTGLSSDHAADAAAAADLAGEVGRVLLGVRAERAGTVAPAELKDLGDQAAQRYIEQWLAERFPGDAVLSEEAADDRGRLGARRVWIVDPLDGTREFSEPPRTDWAVHIALWADGDLVAGAVALPGHPLVLATHPPAIPAPAHGGPPRLVVSRTRPPAFVEALREALGGVLVPMGSAGAKAMAVLRGDADVYAHAGGQYEWDSAAPVAVARAAGLHASRLDGAPLLYNQADVWLPDLLICRPELAAAVLSATRPLLTDT